MCPRMWSAEAPTNSKGQARTRMAGLDGGGVGLGSSDKKRSWGSVDPRVLGSGSGLVQVGDDVEDGVETCDLKDGADAVGEAEEDEGDVVALADLEGFDERGKAGRGHVGDAGQVDDEFLWAL